MIDLEQYQQVDRIFQAALQLDPAERSSFVQRACAGDQTLQKEVESLLAADEQEWGLIDSPAVAAAAPLLTEDLVDISAGQALGHFQVLSLLGKGGMGRVYLAEDERLGRRVALKLLPARLISNEPNRRRFQQEARAASALNHPNILTIYDIGQADGQHFIATEYIDGVTVRTRIKNGPLPVAETLDIIMQVAAALEAAHRAGIVHRDIKPENLMRRADGLVKVLDFGLAKLGEWQPAVEIDSAKDNGKEDANRPETTEALMGTLPYMSPEQVQGLPVDGRSDLFSLGVVLYEMLAGRPPFRGETNGDLITAILEAEPPSLPQGAATLPPGLRQIVDKTLQKDRTRRYQNAGELLFDLKGVQAVRSRVKRLRVGLLLIAALVLVAGVASVWQRFLNRSRAPFQTITIAALPDTADSTIVAISHNGTYAAYVVESASQDVSSVWLKHLESGHQVVVFLAAKVSYKGLTFSPDDRHLYSVRSEHGTPGYAVYHTPVPDGGAVTKIAISVSSSIAFSPDGSRFAFVKGLGKGESALMVANADGSGEQTLAVRKAPDYFNDTAKPVWRPDGQVIACSVGTRAGRRIRKIVEIRVADGAESPIGQKPWQSVGDMEWLTDGSGLVLIGVEKEEGSEGNRQIWHLSYPSGEARKITRDLSFYDSLSLTGDSKTIAASRNEWRRDFWLAANGDSSRAIPITKGKRDAYRFVSWTADGKLLYPSNSSGSREIWMMEADGTGQRQLTRQGRGNHFHSSPSPDGRYLVSCSSHAETEDFNIWRMDADGSNPIQLTYGKGEGQPKCSPDGQWVVYTSATPEGNLIERRLWKVPVAGGEPEQLTEQPSHWPAISPNGQWVACWYQPQPDSWKLAIVPFAGGLPVQLFDVPPDATFQRSIRWTPDGQALTYIVTRNNVSNIWRQALDGSAPEPVTSFTFDTIDCFDWSLDGRLVCSRASQVNDVVLIRSAN